MKLEFGCGDKLTPGYVGVDIRPCRGVKYICPAWEISDHVLENSIDEIVSRHFLEHLTFRQVRATLEAWYLILKPDSLVKIIVPDMDFHIAQWKNPSRHYKKNSNGMTDEEWAISGFWGKQRDDTELWDIHKSGFDYNLLYHYLTEARFKKIQRMNDMPKNLTVWAVR